MKERERKRGWGGEKGGEGRTGGGGRRKWREKGLQIKHTWMKTHTKRQRSQEGRAD